ncbi:MAG: putative rane protein [Fimbriimonadaceae bacterium]|nr:putative rane protein [Fimbriimonadaceae bacterium]
MAALFAVAAPSMAQVKVNMKVGRPENFNRVNPKKVGISNQDRKYMQNAYILNAFEAKLGALAQSRGSDQWVKDFGSDMDREHTLANSELKDLARNKGVYLSNNWPRAQVKTYNRMASLSGSKFDREFRKINKKGHMLAMNGSAKEIKVGRDAMVRSYATKMLATARAHEQLVMTRQTMMARNNYSYGTAAQKIKP